MRPFAFTAALFALLLAGCETAQTPRPAPSAASPAAGQQMVAAAHPLAVEAGLKVLNAGGSAADAAVAVQAVLGLVEPQSSGLGGGAFMTYYDAASGKVSAYNGRETAPAGAGPDLFLGPDGKPLGFATAVLSGRSTGVPGAVVMLGLAQKDHGKLAWKDLFGEAERLADEGFIVTPRLAEMIASRAPQAGAPDAVAYFTKPDGAKYVAGDRLKNPAYAATVRKIAADGPRALLEGEVAQAILARLRQGELPGSMTLADMQAYRAKAVEPVCRPYRIYVVCVPPPPSSGAALLEALGILERTDIAERGPGDAQGWFLFIEASRLMYADRDRYFGDSDFVSVPVEGLLEPAYLDARAKLIPTRGGGPAPSFGTPRGAPRPGSDATREPGGTTHFVIVDKWGNVVSMTTTVESIFGSGRMVGGFFLNNQLTDFSFSPTDADGAPAANAVAPGKRPRSSMSPAIVLDKQGRFVAAVGSPGGNAILAYNLKALVGLLDWKLPVADTLALPNIIARGAGTNGELDRFQPGVVEALGAKGVTMTGGGSAEGSGLHAVRVGPNGLEGAADPRREGQARSQ